MTVKLPGWITLVINIIKKIINILKRERISLFAAQSAYFLLFSAIPLLMLFLNIMRYLVPDSLLANVTVFIDVLPLSIRGLLHRLLDEIMYVSNIPLISISTLLLLWSASRGVRSISIGVRSIYSSTRTKKEKGYIYYTVLSVIYTLLLILIMAISFITVLFGSFIENFAVEKLKLPEFIIKGTFSIRTIFIIVFFTVMLMVIYNRFSDKAMKFRYHFFGALTCSAGWLLFSFFFSLYIDNFSNYSYIYGGLAAVILLMLWLYMCMYIMLLGALINVTIYKYKRLKYH